MEQRFHYSWFQVFSLASLLQDLNVYDKLGSLCKVAMETFLRQNEVLCNSNAETEKQGQYLPADELVAVL